MVPQHVAVAADQDVLAGAGDLDDVVGHQAVAAFDEVQGAFALADAAAAGEQQPHAVDVDQGAVDLGLGREDLLQVVGQFGHEFHRGQGRPDQGKLPFSRIRSRTGRGTRLVHGDEDHRRVEVEHPLHRRRAGPSASRVARKAISDSPKTWMRSGQEILGEAHQGHARPMHIRRRDDDRSSSGISVSNVQQERFLADPRRASGP